jgi:hypothetical protein
MHKQVDPRVWEHREDLILTCTKDTLWAKFKETYPNLLGVTQYFMVLEEELWNLKKAYRETCLCRTCFNCRLFGQGLTVVVKLLEIVPPSNQDADDSAVYTFWTEDEFTVTVSPGIRNRDVRVTEIVSREVEKTKPDKWGYVQTREIWSP